MILQDSASFHWFQMRSKKEETGGLATGRGRGEIYQEGRCRHGVEREGRDPVLELSWA
jgi:hypothetical protein